MVLYASLFQLPFVSVCRNGDYSEMDVENYGAGVRSNLQHRGKKHIPVSAVCYTKDVCSVITQTPSEYAEHCNGFGFHCNKLDFKSVLSMVLLQQS